VRWVPTAVNLNFIDRSCYFSFKYPLSYPHEAEWTPFQTHCFSENLIDPEIEPGTSGPVARNSDHETTEVVNDYINIYFFSKSPDAVNPLWLNVQKRENVLN
jgi:hypothetical protein